ncbi:MAG: aconitase X catalytic domain-containing protein, partial [Candidatus Thermoplasmatota archaeon]|nr:aconitase X catalytic domain-containing protein [Candidatus Thermoplasmatota archaeon]
GEIYDAEKLIPIGSAQVSGISYKSIGDPGVEFLEDVADKGAKVNVLTYINPAGMDLENWRELGFSEDFAVHQMRIIDAFRRMGMVITATCTPYLSGNVPRFREHVAWAESSAISFINSVIGARTNREGGPSALAASIIGKTPNYGLHLEENRGAEVVVDVEKEPKGSDWGALGYLVGKMVKNKIPYFRGIKNARTDELKALGAAMAASGAVALYHVEGITPEAHLQSVDGLERITVTDSDLEKAYETLNTGKEPDIVIFGCPHASIEEINTVAKAVEGKRLKKPLWVCTSRAMKEVANRMGYTQTIENAGGKIVADTCMVVSPIEELGFKTTAVNSGKAACYLPGFCKQNVVFKNVDELIGMVVE